MKKATEKDPIQETICFWQKKAGVVLTPDAAKELTMNISGFFHLLDEWDRASAEKGGEKR